MRSEVSLAEGGGTRRRLDRIISKGGRGREAGGRAAMAKDTLLVCSSSTLGGAGVGGHQAQEGNVSLGGVGWMMLHTYAHTPYFAQGTPHTHAILRSRNTTHQNSLAATMTMVMPPASSARTCRAPGMEGGRRGGGEQVDDCKVRGRSCCGRVQPFEFIRTLGLASPQRPLSHARSVFLLPATNRLASSSAQQGQRKARRAPNGGGGGGGGGGGMQSFRVTVHRR